MDKIQYNKSTKKFDVIEQKTESGHFAPILAERYILEKGYKLDEELSLDTFKELIVEYFDFIREPVNVNTFNKFFKTYIDISHKTGENWKVADFEPAVVDYGINYLGSYHITKLYKDMGHW